MLQASGIEVWTAGDDGMTQRFADAYRAKIADMCSDDRCRGIKATVHQARPLHGNEVEFAVEFGLEGHRLRTSKCIATERDIQACAVKAAEATQRHLSAGR